MISELLPIKMSMVIRTFLVQDRRSASRVRAHLDCRFTHEGRIRVASVKDLSLRGASICSVFMPQKGSHVSLALNTPILKETLVLEGKVVRTAEPSSGPGQEQEFAVHFDHSSVALIQLINKTDFEAISRQIKSDFAAEVDASKDGLDMGSEDINRW